VDIEQIKQVIELMKLDELTEFEIEEEGFKLRICRGKQEQATIGITGPISPPSAAFVETAQGPPTGSSAEGPSVTEEEDKDESITYVESIMVGTFYRSPAPDSPPFVEVGSEVVQDSLVCIIEAMKVMNEIQAEQEGVILEVLVENGQSVEFGQPLFKIKNPSVASEK
jgi:acetyl-CoA carboxylase biotin carboxyl carrier protein